MARKMVVCCDGTWNRPRQETNIFRTYGFLREQIGSPPEIGGRGTLVCKGRAPTGDEVVLFYDQGVGTELGTRFFGGATGAGLSTNIIEAYNFLAANYEPGSEIYCFGFSRGAYTARSLCGFVHAVGGLLENPTLEKVRLAYLDHYALAGDLAAHAGSGHAGLLHSMLFDRLRQQLGVFATNAVPLGPVNPVKLRFLGVYDTVGALGIPLPQAAIARLTEPLVGFHDTTFCGILEHGVHAMAVDEKRAPFLPTLWTVDPGKDLAPGQSALQVWFPGVHSDIGGGYNDKGIGNHTWSFMMEQAAKRGLVLDPAHPTPSLALVDLPSQHESLDAQWRKLSDQFSLGFQTVRSIGLTVKRPDGTEVPVAGDVGVHRSLAGRLDQDVTVILDQDTDESDRIRYAPANVGRDPGTNGPTLPILPRPMGAAVGAA